MEWRPLYRFCIPSWLKVGRYNHEPHEILPIRSESNPVTDDLKPLIDKSITVAIIGLGYVGLPLAVHFGKHFKTIGFDLSSSKIESYRRHIDPAGEVSSEDLSAATLLVPTDDPCRLADADYLIIAVPTPVNAAHQPDFSPLIGASVLAGKYLKQGATVVYESTVYPGATEEVCIPVLERESGKIWKDGFFVGYSPERINPGDKEHTLTRILKIVAGDTLSTLDRLTSLYGAIITAGIHRASSIKVAEAAKVIENTQRDLNIALMNELAIIFDRLGIDTNEVLEAAGTKWNFLKFKPGLVGGHCIGVDPYYLTYKAEMLGYHPQVILAGRRINDGMAVMVAQETIKQMINAGSQVKGARVVVLGLAFKENCADLRNSKVADLVAELASFGIDVIVHDPLVDHDEALNEYQIKLTAWNDLAINADALVLAVAHQQFLDHPINDLLSFLTPSGGVVIDIKSVLPVAAVRAAGHVLWRL